jgi:hypothetical protein
MTESDDDMRFRRSFLKKVPMPNPKKFG